MNRSLLGLTCLFLLLLVPGAAPFAAAAPEPLTAEEEQFLGQQETEDQAGGVQGGDYSSWGHVWSTFDQLGLALLLAALVGAGLFVGAGLLVSFRKKGLPGREKRKWSRKFIQDAEIRGSLNPLHKDSGGITARVKDISRGGAGLELVREASALTPGERIKLQLKTQGQTSLGELTARIRWVAGKNLGVQFDSLDLGYRILESMPLTQAST